MSFRKKVLSILTLIVVGTTLSGCVIDNWEKDFQDFQKKKAEQLENLAKEKSDQIKQDIQDRIDSKIDEIAEGVKDSVSIMGEEGTSATTGDAEESASTEIPEGIELGGTN